MCETIYWNAKALNTLDKAFPIVAVNTTDLNTLINKCCLNYSITTGSGLESGRSRILCHRFL